MDEKTEEIRVETQGQGSSTEQEAANESVRLMDWDLDDTLSETGKSTCSSNYPFGSPNPSDLDEHGNITESADRRRKRKYLSEGSAQRPAYPMSERQQMALLKQITKPEQRIGSSRSPTQTPGSVKSRGKVARVHRRNDRGETPLHTAARRGDHRQCKKLLQEGAQVNCVDYAGWTSLHEACNHGWYKVAKVLLAYGADVNASGLDDDTPLHDAVSSGNKKLVALLLSNNADVNKVNKTGQKAVDTTEEEEIKKLFLGDLPAPSPPVSSCSGTASDRDSDHDLAALSPSSMHLTPAPDKRFRERVASSIEETPTLPESVIMTEHAEDIEEKEDGEITDDTDTKEEEEEGEMKSLDSATEEEAQTEASAKVIGVSAPLLEEKISGEVAKLKLETPEVVSSTLKATKTEKPGSECIEIALKPDNVVSTDPKLEGNPQAGLAEDLLANSDPIQKGFGEVPSIPVASTHLPLKRSTSGIRSPRLGPSPHQSATAAAVKSLRKRDMIFRKRHQLQQQQQQDTAARKKRRAEIKGRKRKLDDSTGADIYDFHSSESEQEGERGEPRRLFHSKQKTPPKPSEASAEESPNTEDGNFSPKQSGVPDISIDPAISVVEINPAALPKRTGMTRKDRLLRQVSTEGATESPTTTVMVEKSRPTEESTEEPLKVPPLRIILPSTSRSASDDEATVEATAVVVRSSGQPYVFRGPEGDEVASESGNRKGPAGNGGSGNSSQDGNEKSQRLTRSQLRAGRGQLEAPPPARAEEGGTAGSGIVASGGAKGPRKPWGAKAVAKLIEPTSSINTASKSHWSTTDSSQTTGILKKNSYEAYRDLRHIVEGGWSTENEAEVKEYVPPQNFENFLINKKTYLLQKSLSDAPQEISPPQTLTEPMLSLFKKQESQRHSLRCQHKVERERLSLCCEKEVLRSHARQTKATFLTAARVMGDAEIYNPLGLEKHVKVAMAAQTPADLDVDDLESIKLKFKQKKAQLINRQKMEGISLQSSQLMTWEAQMKKAGLVEPSQWHKLEKARKKTAASVPTVQVVEDFDLLPGGYGV